MLWKMHSLFIFFVFMKSIHLGNGFSPRIFLHGTPSPWMMIESKQWPSSGNTASKTIASSQQKKKETCFETRLQQQRKSSSSDDEETKEAPENNGDIMRDQLPDDKDYLTEQELQDAVALYTYLPRDIQQTLRRAVTKSSNNKVNELEPVNDVDIVLRLFKQRKNLLKYPGTWVRPTKETSLDNLLKDLDDTIQTPDLERFVSIFFPAETRKGKEFEPTQMDADDILKNILGKDSFNPKSKPEKIPGGFLIRGTNQLKTGEELIDTLDNRLEKYCASFQLNGSEEEQRRKTLNDRVGIIYCKDPTPEIVKDLPGDTEIFGESVLVLLGKDFTPETNVKNVALSVSALVSTFVFSVGCFGTTNDVPQQMVAFFSGENDELKFINSMLPTLIGSLFFIQMSNELGHILAAWQGKFKSTFTAWIPGVFLPGSGVVRSITSSPKNFQSLFDFGLTGPIFGIVTSLLLLYVGLENTISMDAENLKYLPTLSLEYVKASSLGAGIIDAALGGSILQLPTDAATSVKVSLDPLAIAGFCGLMVNALNLLPLGKTDGMRIATTLFGRFGSNIVQLLCFFTLVLAGLFGKDKSHILLAYALLSDLTFKFDNVTDLPTRTPLEVPCRNEIDSIDIPRVLLAITAWVLVGLILIPAS